MYLLFYTDDRFRNSIQTNSCSVEFIFRKKPNKVHSNTDKVQNALTPKAFVEKIKNNETLVWGVDSGSLSSKERIRKTSIKECYHMCGFNLAIKEHMRLQKQNQDFRFISELSIFKISILINFSYASSVILKSY